MAVGEDHKNREAEAQIMYIGGDGYKDHRRAYIVSRESRFRRVIKRETV
ncbi:MAG: hypothetical protein BWY80_00599 [Firmicutes bacterium ADurb.Bin456]|nr:MAG: hypothetical protein BWY80_00599 [Firmicutes bacterium ADurb.Bin456]